MSKKEKKQIRYDDEPVTLDIPDNEIWTYQIPGLAAPHIGKPYKHYNLKKIIFIVVIIIAISLSCYFSIRTVQKQTFEFTDTGKGTYELYKFSNTGFVEELNINYVSELKYKENDGNPDTNFYITTDENKKVTSIREYAFNCDEKIKSVKIGENVTKIDGKSFYSCWNLETIYVDKNNPNYCDIDGVLYNKEMTEIICYPVNHDAYLCEKYGYKQYNEDGEWDEPTPEDKNYDGYKRDVLTYVLPQSVTKIGELSMNYAYLTDVYMPQGVTNIETLAFFKATKLENIHSYNRGMFSSILRDTHFEGEDKLGVTYNSLPEGLKYIGSDAFSYNQAMDYLYIPSSVKEIGHHAFWDTVYKESGELKGIKEINIAASEEEFKNVKEGDHWKPQYDYLLFKKYVDVQYDSQRDIENNINLKEE